MGDATMFFAQESYKPPRGFFAEELSYYIYRPQLPAEGRLPLVLVLHDGQGMAAAARYLISRPLRRFYPAYIVVPVLPKGHHWGYPGAEESRFSGRNLRVRDALALVRDLSARYPVDAERIYVIGCAEGGYGVFAALAQSAAAPEIAAGVALGGGWRLRDAPLVARTPFWAIHHAFDPVYPASTVRRLVREVRRHNGTAHYTEIDDMPQGCQDPRFYINAMWGWLFSQRRAVPEPAIAPSP